MRKEIEHGLQFVSSFEVLLTFLVIFWLMLMLKSFCDRMVREGQFLCDNRMLNIKRMYYSVLNLLNTVREETVKTAFLAVINVSNAQTSVFFSDVSLLFVHTVRVPHDNEA
jgi:hypothetical protein